MSLFAYILLYKPWSEMFFYTSSLLNFQKFCCELLFWAGILKKHKLCRGQMGSVASENSLLQSLLVSYFAVVIWMCSDFRSVFVSGTAGCVATLLHDAVMNPAEGKGSILRVKMCIYIFFFISKQQFWVSVRKPTGATPGPTIFTCWPQPCSFT